MFKKLSLSAALVLTACVMSTNVYAQTETPEINIAGDVYGGGKEGHVGVGNIAKMEGTTLTPAPENAAAAANTISLTQSVADAVETTYTTNIEINDGKVRTVFGGGKNGRVFGSANTKVVGGEIGGDEWDNTVHGGVFGAGDGSRALVFGCSFVTVEGGKVWNNVYGGGNQADLWGTANVTLQGGRVYGNVFGSARMADVLAYAQVVIDSKNQKDSLFVKGVYGGNDISGITRDLDRLGLDNLKNANWFVGLTQLQGKAMKPSETAPEWMADETETVAATAYSPARTVYKNRAINQDQIWSNYVYATAKAEGNELPLFIGNTFGGSNGNYKYDETSTPKSLKLPFHRNADGTPDKTWCEDDNGNKITPPKAPTPWLKEFRDLNTPNTFRSYLQIEGGSYGYVYGGGNKASVLESTDIYINNPDKSCLVPRADIERMGIQTTSYTLVYYDKDKKEITKEAYQALTGDDLAKAKVYAKFDYNMDRVFGGNNVAAMDIRPNWYLIQGNVNNLYGGGNKGNMTHEHGLLVNVFKNNGVNDKDPLTGNAYPVDAMKINNIYGGCRMADVRPGGAPATETNYGYDFREGYSARVYISGGRINNVYGGNDVSGYVAWGTDVEIHGAISGDVYGGGNGAYPYTDNAELAAKYPDEWGDYYYEADTEGDTDAMKSLAGMYTKRPHVENTLVHIAGEGEWISNDKATWRNMIKWLKEPAADNSDLKTAVKVAYEKNEDGKWVEVGGDKVGYVLTRGEEIDKNRVYVVGGVYCGGNSATLVNGATTEAKAEFQIGQCVTMDKLFLGSNGERMVDVELLSKYAKGVIYDPVLGKHRLVEDDETGVDLATFDLTQSDQMAEYMKGCEMNIMPQISYDNPDNVYTAENINTYRNKGIDVSDVVAGEEIDVSVDPDADMDEAGLNFSTRIGSFFVGGNVGSINVDGVIGEATGLKFPRELVIYNKVVGGCNNANVPYRAGINAFYLGGVKGDPVKQEDLTTLYANVGTKISKAGENDPGLKIQLYVPCRMEPRVLNTTEDADGYVTVDMSDPEPWSAPTVISDHGIESDVVGPVQILDRGNIYGGCYQSGYVNGSVQIDIKDELCSTPQMRAYFGDMPLLGQEEGQDGTAAVVDNMRRYVLNHGWSAFGGGYGRDTEIWGNVYMNMSRNAGYINAYGGSQLGFIGKIERYTETTADVEVLKRDANGAPIPDPTTGVYQTEEVTKYPGDYKQEVQQFTTTTTTTTTTTEQNYDRYTVDNIGGVTVGGSTYMNLKHDIHRSPVSIFGLNALYGGGFEGVVTGNTHMYAGGGLHYDVFGGACNADIYGYAETFVGIDREGQYTNNLQLRHCVYGGNDFGGQVLGTGTHKVYDPETGTEKEVTSNTYVKYLGGTIERSLFGGSCGLYRYNQEYTLKAEDFEGGKFKYQDLMIGDQRVDAATISSYKAGDKIRLYPEGSWDSMPTLFTNLKGAYDSTNKTYANANHFNAVVDIASTQEPTEDVAHGVMPNRILGNIYGGGYGMCDELGRVDMRDAYVLLHGPVAGTKILVDNVFGGGYFSYVENAILDAVSGNVRTAVYGGTFGTTVDAGVAAILHSQNVAKAKTQTSTWGSGFNADEYEVLTELELTELKNADYTGKTVLLNVWPAFTQNSNVDVYGAGAYTGADDITVNLYGGKVDEVHGGSNQEGVCNFVDVNVPNTVPGTGQPSSISMTALYGGGHGSYPALPCDVRNATIYFDSSSATVRNGRIFGGNNAARATHNAVIHYNAQAKDEEGNYLDLFGAGFGQLSVAGNTHVFVSDTSVVRNVYGGGYAGQVFNKYDVLKDASGAPTDAQKNLIIDSETRKIKKAPEESDGSYAAYKSAFDAYTNYHDASTYLRYTKHEPGHVGNSYAHWYETTPHFYEIDNRDIDHQTHVKLSLGAQVKGSVYGAGYGEQSTVSGKTLVDCNGATIDGDIFGGGYAGNVRKMTTKDTGYQEYDNETYRYPKGYTPGTGASAEEIALVKEENLVDSDDNYDYYRIGQGNATQKFTKGYTPADDASDEIKALVQSENLVKSDDNYDYYRIVKNKDNYIVQTEINMNGGTVRNIFGGGYAGAVGGEYEWNTEKGLMVATAVTTATKDFTAETHVNIGTDLKEDTNHKLPGDKDYITTHTEEGDLSHDWGKPNINFSVYGAGDRGPVFGSAIVRMYNGYIGYDYRQYTEAEWSALPDNEKQTLRIADINGKNPGEEGYVETYPENYYIERLKSSASDALDLMKEDGNLYGGGFGEDARVLSTDVVVYDGVIRNSLYGGGEMSAVGWGTVSLDATTNELKLEEVQAPGATFVEIYGGQINADAFAGGRGYSFDNFGEKMYGTKFNTDGFVFGKTDINIYRGTIGTDETIKESNGSHGNIFGGGNVGYVFSGSGAVNEKTASNTTGDGFYYKVNDINTAIGNVKSGGTASSSDFFVDANGNKKLTEDARVNVQVYGKALKDIGTGTEGAVAAIPFEVEYHPGFSVPNVLRERFANGHAQLFKKDAEGGYTVSTDNAALDEDNRVTIDVRYVDDGKFAKGDYIPNEALNSLKNTDPQWASIDQSGITIRNAVFAGGNVSKGSDKVYAFANTVFGNATAAIVDVYCRDLIDVGADGLGGLYGDGNLTFVDGYRELNVTNYGTDYYALSGNIDFNNEEDVKKYNDLTKRQQDFYTAKYTCTAAIEPYSVGDVINSSDLENLAKIKGWPENWEEAAFDKTNKENPATGEEAQEYWAFYFRRSAAIINEGRFLNTLQRADYCGLKGSRLVMKGAMDRAIGEGEDIDYTPYTINRVGELSLNQNNSGVDGKVHGSYVGIYNVVKYLGAMSSDKNFVTGLVDESAGISQSSIRETNSTNAADLQAVPGISIDEETGEVKKTAAKKVYIPGNETLADATNTTHNASEAQTFFEWKIANHDQNNRNNGTSPNKIALASGVYLELVSGLDDKGEKIYGPIIGVVELDLLNVAPGEGGGFVYAKNHHGLPHFDTNLSYASVLSDANYHLKTVRAYSYDDEDDAPALFNGVETSGNFVHSTKRILDDCFPVGQSFVGVNGINSIEDASPAHYWYLRGDYYVYDQLISAYTGNADTYSSELNIPLNLNGKLDATLQLLNVLPGLYTYDEAAKYIDEEHSDTLSVIFDNITKNFGHNDPVSYWDWHNMTAADQGKFVLKTYTYTGDFDISVNNKTYTFGQAILPAEYEELKNYDVPISEGNKVKANTLFSETNGVNNDNGFLLTLDLTNPDDWNDRYTKQDASEIITNAAFKKLTSNEADEFVKSATFTVKDGESGVYGKYTFTEGNVTSKTVYDMQAPVMAAVEASLEGDSEMEAKLAEIKNGLAKFEEAYVTVDSCEVKYKENSGFSNKTLMAGYTMSKTEYDNIESVTGIGADGKPVTEKTTLINPAYICVSTIEVAEKKFRYLNQVIPASEYNTYTGDKATYNDKSIQDKFQEAYICTGGEASGSHGGSWGGKYYEAGKVYQGKDVCQVVVDTEDETKDERKHFTFNYDALDLLRTDYKPYNPSSYDVASDAYKDVIAALKAIGSAGTADVAYYDAETPTSENAYYRLKYDLDVEATYNATDGGFTYIEGTTPKTVTKDVKLSGAEYKNLPNEQKNYVMFNVTDADQRYKLKSGDTYIFKADYGNLTEDQKKGYELATDDKKYGKYIVKTSFDVAGKMYNAGQSITPAEYNALSDGNKTNIDLKDITSDGKWYYCINDYTEGEKNGHISGMAEGSGKSVTAGTVIGETAYTGLPNYQRNFTLTGKSPIEEATLYVPASASILDLLKDRYVTAVYEYRYTECNDKTNYETFVEKHIINIRIKFMDGQPKIGELTPPDIILPKENITMNLPIVEEGAFPIVGAGWEIYPTFEDAQRHVNGAPYDNGRQPLYWYQNGYYIAYYAETSRGRTYSAPVEIRVANYHKLSDVVNDANHLFIDHKDCDRDPKIYIFDTPEENATSLNKKKFIDIKNQIGYTTATGGDKNMNEIDALKYLFELSTSPYAGLGGKITENDAADGKILIQNHGRSFQNCENLEFYLNSDVEQIDFNRTEKQTVGEDEKDVTVTDNRPWTSIGDEHNCFSGNLHGNGFTISGLEESLFAYLCGNVYNLGVTGSFVGSGVADHGSGRAENCWIWTTAKPAEGKASLEVKAVMGDDGAATNPATVVNCYYPDVNAYAEGTAVPRTASEFVNGQVAYDLNRFYLDARHAQHKSAKVTTGFVSGTGATNTGGTSYNSAIYRMPNGNMEMTTPTGAANDEQKAVIYPLEYDETETTRMTYDWKSVDEKGESVTLRDGLGYVESLYADGDFRYEDALKPKTADIREVTQNVWLPVFPDDYIFFGQKLSYKLYDERVHDQHPVAVAKYVTTVGDNKVIDNTKSGLIIYSTANQTNRLYRAPAYFRNGTYGKSAIFNVQAAFRSEIKVGDPKAGSTETSIEYDDDVMPYEGLVAKGTYYPHKDMTAIDFTGYNDATWTRGTVNAKDNARDYKPLLDFERLDAIQTNGLTQNLLAYSPAPGMKSGSVDNESVDTKTNKVLTEYFADPAFADYGVEKSGSVATNSVQKVIGSEDYSKVKGHVVQVNEKNASGEPTSYISVIDHLLIDRQDFYAPIEYEFQTGNNGKRMWYQREPTYYAEGDYGWDGVSLPFKVERVATQDKGEITHFYTGSTRGHEYWLREYTGMPKQDKAADTDPDVYVANFALPAAGTSTKNDDNLFLWNYYYSEYAQKDVNEDIYQKYYSAERTYSSYPFEQAGKPYIAGFPGKMYYEFDLSGQFKPEWTKGTIDKLPAAQIISFVSAEGATIGVSDTECKAVSENGYDFMPTYLNNVETTDDVDYYSLNNAGSAFDKVTQTEVESKMVTAPFSVAFRPYFKTAPTAAGGAKSRAVKSIVFGMGKDTSLTPDEGKTDEAFGINAYGMKGKLLIQTNVKDEEVSITITNAAGAIVAEDTMSGHGSKNYRLPAGMYIVNKVRKVFVR